MISMRFEIYDKGRTLDLIRMSYSEMIFLITINLSFANSYKIRQLQYKLLHLPITQTI